MNFRSLVFTIFLIFSLTVFSQPKEIRVQIMHNNKIYVDSAIQKSPGEAKIIIENLLQGYTTQNVNIDAELTHGLYVFTIDDETWIEPATNTKVNLANNATEIEVNEVRKVAPPEKQESDIAKPDESIDFEDTDVDSLFREFSKELNGQWNEADFDILIDSVGNSFEQLWHEIKKADFQNTPEFQDLKRDFKDVFEKFMDTKVIIIQDGDTLKID